MTGLGVRWPVCKQGVQALFEQCQASMDPNSIAQLLAHHPYHIDALLAMFELYRFTFLLKLHLLILKCSVNV